MGQIYAILCERRKLLQEEGGRDYPRQHPTTYHTSSGVPGKKMGLEKSH